MNLAQQEKLLQVSLILQVDLIWLNAPQTKQFNYKIRSHAPPASSKLQSIFSGSNMDEWSLSWFLFIIKLFQFIVCKVDIECRLCSESFTSMSNLFHLNPLLIVSFIMQNIQNRSFYNNYTLFIVYDCTSLVMTSLKHTFKWSLCEL